MGKLILGLAVVLAATSGAYADMVSPGFSFSGSQQSFTASLSASGSATLSGNGTYYSWVGWPVSSWASVTISMNNQTVGLGTNPDTIAIDRDPTGNGQVQFERLFTTFDNTSLLDLNVSDLFGGSPQGLALDRVTLNGAVNSPLGDIPVEFRIDTTGSLSNFYFDMQGGAWTLRQDPATPYDGNAQFMWIGTGQAGVSYNLALDGELEVWGLFTVDLGTLLSMSDNLDLDDLLGGPVPLIGSMTLTELAGPYPKDVEVHINSNFDQFTPVTVPFTTAGAYVYNSYSGGTNSYYVVNLNYDFAGSLTVGDVTIDLYSTIVDIIPEPMSLAVFGIGAGLLTMARRRRS